MLRLFFLVSLVAATLFGQGRNQPRGKAGEFDLYLLSSPGPRSTAPPQPAPATTPSAAASAGTSSSPTASRPQYDRGWPQFCASSQTLSNALVEKMMDIMPSRRLIRHEWDKHGVCTGLSAADYFGKARAAFSGIKVPKSFQSPKPPAPSPPAKIKDEVLAANPGLPRKPSPSPAPVAS